LSEGMQLAALRHTKMAEELTTFWAAVSSTTESVLVRSPSNTSHAEVVGELAAEFQKAEDQRSRHEQPPARICDLLLGPPPIRAGLADRLGEAARQLRVNLATWGDAELETLRTLVARVQDLVLGGAGGPSSLAASMSTMVEQLEGQIDNTAANVVHWGPVLHWLQLCCTSQSWMPS
jgi:hypothetical protein